MPFVNFHRRKGGIESLGEKLEVVEDIIKKGESIEGRLSHSSSTESSHQNSSDSAEAEIFENLDYASNSPIARTPPIDAKKFEDLELELEQTVRGSTHSNAYEQLALFLAMTVHIRELSIFITMFFRNGGVPFLFVYAIELIVFGIPYGLMELSIGQYASLPAVVLFGRIAPIVSGVGYLLLLGRVLRSLFVAIEPRYFIYIHKALLGLVISEHAWLSCDTYPQWICKSPYKDDCDHGVNIGEQCLTRPNVNNTNKMWTSEAYIRMTRHADGLFSFTPGHIFYLLLENYKASLVVGTFMVYATSGLISSKGTRFFSKISFILIITPLFSMACVFLYTVGDVSGDIFWEIVKPDWSKFFALNTWIDATQAVSKTMCVADGTMITLGSLSTFNNNIFRDVTLVAICGFVIRIFFIICLLPLIAITFDPLGFSIAELCNVQSTTFWPNLVFWKLVDVGNGHSHNVMSLIFHIGMVVSMIGYHVITYEVCLGAIYQRFPRLLYLPEKIVRYCLFSIIVISFTLIHGGAIAAGWMDTILKLHQLVYLEVIICLTLYQVIAVIYLYGAKRLLVNMKTMCAKHMTVKYTKYGNLVAQFFWSFLLPLAIFGAWVGSGVIYTFRTFNMTSIYASIVGFIPIYVGLFKVVSCYLHQRPLHNLFQTHRNWGPINMHHRRNADHDERAARILI